MRTLPGLILTLNYCYDTHLCFLAIIGEVHLVNVALIREKLHQQRSFSLKQKVEQRVRLHCYSLHRMAVDVSCAVAYGNRLSSAG